MAVKIIPALLLWLLISGCTLQHPNTLSSMADFRKIKPALDLQKLAGKKTLSNGLHKIAGFSGAFF